MGHIFIMNLELGHAYFPKEYTSEADLETSAFKEVQNIMEYLKKYPGQPFTLHKIKIERTKGHDYT